MAFVMKYMREVVENHLFDSLSQKYNISVNDLHDHFCEFANLPKPPHIDDQDNIEKVDKLSPFKSLDLGDKKVTIKVLKEYCRETNQKMSGTKQQLKDKLVDYYKKEDEAAADKIIQDVKDEAQAEKDFEHDEEAREIVAKSAAFYEPHTGKKISKALAWFRSKHKSTMELECDNYGNVYDVATGFVFYMDPAADTIVVHGKIKSNGQVDPLLEKDLETCIEHGYIYDEVNINWS